jgi:Ni,Fe-hydrogenase I cytochrome b subunit
MENLYALGNDSCVKDDRTMTKKNNNYLQRFNRLLIWSTVVLFIVFAFSGYGITRPEVTTELTNGIFTRNFSMYLHLHLAGLVLILLLIHVLIGLKIALARWGVEEGKLLNAFIIILGLFVGALIILMQYLML